MLKQKIQLIWQKFPFVKQYQASHGRKKFFYLTASILDVICITLILINGARPAQRILEPLISPLMTSLHSSNPLSFKNKTTDETFSFAPSWSENKLRKIDFNGLNYLAFFDLPVLGDGTINKDSRSYQAFDTPEILDLVERAHYSNTKVLLTLTSIKSSDINQLLSNKSSWKNLVQEITEEVKSVNADGITLDFELHGTQGHQYQSKYTEFLSYLTEKLHQTLPGSIVTVAVPDNASEASLYNKTQLAKVADKVLIMAYNVAVPEEKNSNPITPVFGFNDKDYWEKISNGLNNFFGQKIEKTKLVMERAWYGNGDKYPLYTPNSTPPSEDQKEPAHVFLDHDTVNRLASNVPSKGREAARTNIPVIGKALQEEGILDSNVLAYALATIEHETDKTFAPIDEIQGRMSARRLGYEGGINYFGRGFIQLTHLRNYKAMGQRIGMGDELVKSPELASTPEVAAKILAAFFKDNNIANLASKGYFVAARRPVNPDYNGYHIAQLAWKYEGELN
jgi:hypothetical protein